MNDRRTISRRTLVKSGLGAIAAPAVLRVLPAEAQSQVIKIGHVSPKTGPLAGFGEADGFILDQVRAILAKGLENGGKTYKVEIISKDSQSSGNRAAEVAAELILGDKVDLIVGLGNAGHHQPGRRSGRSQRGAVHHHQLPVAALFLRPQRRSGEGLQLDLSFLLGPRGRHRLIPRAVGRTADQQGRSAAFSRTTPTAMRGAIRSVGLPPALAAGRLQAARSWPLPAR